MQRAGDYRAIAHRLFAGDMTAKELVRLLKEMRSEQMSLFTHYKTKTLDSRIKAAGMTEIRRRRFPAHKT
ncbi:MAG: hypothetical protein AABZ23_00715 [Deltaproteobacteria bacterium]